MNLRYRLPYRPGTAVIALAFAAMLGTIAGCNSAINDGANPATTTTSRPASIEPVPAELDGPKLAARDVKVNTCKIGAYGVVTVSMTIINHGAKAASYTVSGEILDPAGVRQGEFAALTVNPLSVGKTAKLTATGFVDDHIEAARCRLTKAQRF